jgi:hypothetical protein
MERIKLDLARGDRKPMPRSTLPVVPRRWTLGATASLVPADGATAADYAAGTAVHDRTFAHKNAVREWVRDLAAAAGAQDPTRWPRAHAAAGRWPGR